MLEEHMMALDTPSHIMKKMPVKNWNFDPSFLKIFHSKYAN